VPLFGRPLYDREYNEFGENHELKRQCSRLIDFLFSAIVMWSSHAISYCDSADNMKAMFASIPSLQRQDA
jgi:hypothetical protein